MSPAVFPTRTNNWKKNQNKTTTHLENRSSSRISSVKLCCSRAEPDEADYTLSVCLCHCCVHISFGLSLTHTHAQTHTHDFREGDGTCVCVCARTCSAICWDEITVVLIESTSDATSHGSRPSEGRHAAAMTLVSRLVRFLFYFIFLIIQ